MRKYIICLVICLLVVVCSVQAQKLPTIEEKILDEGSARVIVYFPTEQATPQALGLQRAARVRSAAPTRINQLEDSVDLPIINGFAGELSADDLEAFKREYPNAIIQEDIVYYLDAIEETELGTQTSISVPSIGANYSWNVLGRSGTNMTIAVIDSGIHYDHSDLGGCFGAGCKVLGGYDYVDNDNDPDDDNGHGTHVAGIISANGTVIGVAPNSSLYALKACNAAGACNSSAIISSMSWAVSNDADVISISIGGSGATTRTFNTGMDALSLAVDNTVAQGIPVIISAGNQATSSGDDNGESSIAVPGASKQAITVAALDDKNTITTSDDTTGTFSLHGPSGFGRYDPDIAAPGVGIYSTYLSGGYATQSGTSMAAPHVSGLVALLLEGEPSLTPQQIRARLISSSYAMPENIFIASAGGIRTQQLLTTQSYALVDFTNTHNEADINDRWEAIAIPDQQIQADITIHTNRTTTFTASLDDLDSAYDANTLSADLFAFPSEITTGSSETFTINLTVQNGTPAGTYGGILTLTGDTTDRIKIPIVITVPIMYNITQSLTFDDNGAYTGDVYAYAYYNPYTGNDTITIGWSSGSDDFDLWLHTHNGSYLDNRTTLSNPESITTTDSTTIKWLRIHAYDFTGASVAVTLNITDNDNAAPQINSFAFNHSTIVIGAGTQLMLNFSDDDNSTVLLNDSNFIYDAASSNHSLRYYNFTSNSSSVGNTTVMVTIIDSFDLEATATATITVLNTSLQITAFSPSDTSITIEANQTQTFNVTASDYFNRTINYSWYVNESLNATDNIAFTFNASEHTIGEYNITLLVNTTEENATQTWNLTIIATNNPVIFNTSTTIPNLTWNEGSNNLGALNLSTYFYDDDNITPTYTLINTTDITMTVDNESMASFFVVDNDYFGTSQVQIRANDSRTNASSNIFTITINDVAEPSSGSGGSSGGGGGSGGGSSGGGGGAGTAGSSADFTRIVIDAKNSIKISSNSAASVLEEISIDINQEKDRVRIIVKQVEEEDDQPAVVQSFVNRRYSTITIDHDDLADEEITAATIAFKVEKSWLEQNGVDADDIRLYRYTTDWDELPTKQTTGNATHQFFVSDSPGLSTFIIGVANVTTTQEENNTEEISKELPELELRLTDEQEEVTVQETRTEAAQQSIRSYLQLHVLIIMLAVVLLIGLGVEFYRHHRRIGQERREQQSRSITQHAENNAETQQEKQPSKR